MGYRALIKKYIRHLELVAGDNYIEAEGNEPVLSGRDIGELRTLSAEIARDAYQATEVMRVENYNYRLRVLMNRYALTSQQVAELCDVADEKVRCWRTSPNSRRYEHMSEDDFAVFEKSLTRWLETA
jgi:hypothetical protein